MRSGRGLLLLGLVGVAFGTLAVAQALQAGASGDRALIDFVVGETYLLGGLFAWRRQPDNRTWKLMSGVGFGWFVGDFATSPIPLVKGFGEAFADTDAIFLNWLVLAYPTGRVEGVVARAVVILSAIGLTSANIAFVVTRDATPNLVIGLTTVAALGILVPRRWILAPRSTRRVLGPAVFAISVTLLAVATAIVVRLANVPQDIASFVLSARDVGALAIPIGFVLGSFQLVEEELRMSRTRIVEATDAERRRLERDLHDGAQQRFVALSMALRVLRAKLGREVEPEIASTMDAASEQLRAGIAELRELARGIHPAVLSAEGLAGALPVLAERSTVPTSVISVPDRRFPPAIEATAYFVASEALANVGKYASAQTASIAAATADGRLRVEVRDDGVGGADMTRGTGLAGLVDRVAALGGELRVDSPAGGGTSIIADIPIYADS